MDHGLAIETRVRDGLLRLAKDLQLPMVATNDLHYTDAADADAHEALLCVQSGKTMDDPNRFKFDARDFYLKSPAEMRALWDGKYQLREACDNTLLIAERCSVAFDEIGLLHAAVPGAGGGDRADLVRQGGGTRVSAVRFPDGIPPEVQKQADFEVGVITQMNFPGYFLVVADFINWAKDNGIRVGPGRGSGAGSMVAYAMRITDLNPLQHGLIFERFLNPDRVSMPDFDVDFDERRRGDVIRYVTEKYGDDRVAQIVTYGTIKAKQAVKDSARVLGMPFSVGDRITKVMPPPVMGKDVSLAKMFEPSRPAVQRGRRVPDAGARPTRTSSEVVEMARGLEGLKRQWGVHAAGVIMSSDPLLDLIPIMKREQDGAIITQFDYPTCEKLGLIKMDFLGLRNLTVLDDALANIQANRGETVVLEDLHARRPEGLRAAGPRRHARGVPARRRADAGAAALDEAGQLRGHLGRRRAVPAGADGRQLAQRLRRPQEQPQAGRPDPPRAGRAAGRDPRRHLRSHRLPGAGDGDRAAGRRLLARRRPTCCAGRWARRRSPSWTPSSRSSPAGWPSAGYSQARDQDAVGHPAAVLRLRVQQGALGGLRADVVLDRLPEGELPGRVHGRAADLASATTRTRWPSTWPSAGRWASRCCRRTSTPRCGTSRRSAPTSGSGCPRCATSAPGWSRRSSPAARTRAPTPTSTTSWRRSTQVACNKKVVESLIKAGAFDSLEPSRARAC